MRAYVIYISRDARYMCNMNILDICPGLIGQGFRILGPAGRAQGYVLPRSIRKPPGGHCKGCELCCVVVAVRCFSRT